MTATSVPACGLWFSRHAEQRYDARFVENVLTVVEADSALAADIEARLWAAYEQRFAQAHDLALAYRYAPADDEERAHVERHFPPLTFGGKDGLSVQRDYEGITCSGWEAKVPFADIKSATLAERIFKKHLCLKLTEGGMFKSTRSVCMSKLDAKDAVVDAFNRYYGRRQASVAHHDAQT